MTIRMILIMEKIIYMNTVSKNDNGAYNNRKKIFKVMNRKVSK